MDHLSDEWLAAMADAIAAQPVPDDALPTERVVVEVLVVGVPGGGSRRDVRYQVHLDRTGVRLEPDGDADATVRLTQDHATAAAIAAGRRSAQQAFLDGDLRIGGDATALVRAAPALAALDGAAVDVARRTDLSPTAGGTSPEGGA